MNNATPRFKALLAGGAALVVFGITVPATATSGVPGPPPVGSVGKAGTNAVPPGQTVDINPDADADRGFRCDGNNGAGDGNPALGTCTPPLPGTGAGAGGDWYNNT